MEAGRREQDDFDHRSTVIASERQLGANGFSVAPSSSRRALTQS
jgi:hypothetical protein